MASSPSFGFGIIGVGMIADYHAQAIAATNGGKLVGIATRNADNARSFAQKHRVPVATTSVDELVARPDIHVVCVTTPSGAHLEAALTAIRAGKHVVIEKPIEITTERADVLLDAAAKAGVQVAPIFQARFGEGARALKAAVDAGRFGRLVLASAYVKWHRPKEYYTGWKGTLKLDGGGALINQAIHAIDLLQWFAGLPSEVFCWTTRRVYQHIEAEDTAIATLKFPDGALGTIEASTALWPGWQRRVEIVGEHGSAMLEDDHLSHWGFRDPLPVDDAIRAAKIDPAMASGAGAANAITHHGHRRQIQDLIDSLAQGRPVAVDGREARKAVALIRGLYASAERGVPVKL
ncbi:MAG TPA: Gfo/Idh/MocA family oxidoreductase [Opitutaceae bacterium]|nr:Gfo/Idh/MocA family oxidoreductase [Opitutaceae bacterium]